VTTNTDYEGMVKQLHARRGQSPPELPPVRAWRCYRQAVGHSRCLLVCLITEAIIRLTARQATPSVSCSWGDQGASSLHAPHATNPHLSAARMIRWHLRLFITCADSRVDHCSSRTTAVRSYYRARHSRGCASAAVECTVLKYYILPHTSGCCFAFWGWWTREEGAWGWRRVYGGDM